MSFFLRRMGERAEAEDLTQEIFVRIRGTGEKGGIRDADALVFKIAVNLLRDRAPQDLHAEQGSHSRIR